MLLLYKHRPSKALLKATPLRILADRLGRRASAPVFSKLGLKLIFLWALRGLPLMTSVGWPATNPAEYARRKEGARQTARTFMRLTRLAKLAHLHHRAREAFEAVCHNKVAVEASTEYAKFHSPGIFPVPKHEGSTTTSTCAGTSSACICFHLYCQGMTTKASSRLAQHLTFLSRTSL